MPSKEVTLEVAAFLASNQAKDLAPHRDDVRRIVEIFLSLCHEEVGKKPHLLDGQDMHFLFGHLLPGRLARKDPVSKHVAGILTAYVDYLETTRMVSQAYEIRRALEETTSEFSEAVRTGKNVHHTSQARQDPFVHRAPKLGRNDPCFCGSGKKFKKCHGGNG